MKVPTLLFEWIIHLKQEQDKNTKEHLMGKDAGPKQNSNDKDYENA